MRWSFVLLFHLCCMTMLTQCDPPEKDPAQRRLLLLMRHAKAEGYDKPDFERGLKKRGEEDAVLMTQLLTARGIRPDYIVSSAARRTVATAQQVVNVLGQNLSEVVLDSALYHCNTRVLIDVVHQVAAEHKTVLLIGHNPSIIEAANHFQRDSIFMQVPTSGMVAIEFYGENWADVHHHLGRLLFYDYPKLHKQKDADPNEHLYTR